MCNIIEIKSLRKFIRLYLMNKKQPCSDTRTKSTDAISPSIDCYCLYPPWLLTLNNSSISLPKPLVVICEQQPQGDLDFPRTRTVTFGSRAFAVCGPICWNALPPSLKSPSLKPGQFCSLLKTTLMAQPS